MTLKGKRPKGSENTLFRLTYSEIARLSGLSRTTVVQYAGQHKYNPRNIESVIHFANAHRAKHGLPPLGNQP